VASFYSATAKADDLISQAQKLTSNSGGGDWDRNNRLKVYQALQMLLHRDLLGASSLFLECMATFSCTEMCPYPEFIVYAILTNLLHLPRVELKEKIVDGTEVISVAKEIPIVVSANETVKERNTAVLALVHLAFFAYLSFSSATDQACQRVLQLRLQGLPSCHCRCRTSLEA
jgi:hypothetical protein